MKNSNQLPVIKYSRHGESVFVYAALNGIEHMQGEISAAKDGWSSCWQENDLYNVSAFCQKRFPNGFIFPYTVDQGSGYVSTVDIDTATKRAYARLS